jgi:predicted permease
MTDRLRLRLRSLVRRCRVERELDEEIRYHLEELTRQNMKRGLSPAEARSDALRRFGAVTQIQEDCRDKRRTRWLEDLAGDARYALRTLWKTPAFTAAVLASLALGIGANTAVFTLIHAVILRPLPVPQPEELVEVTASPVFSFAMYRDVCQRQRVFTGIMASSREFPVRLNIPRGTESFTLDNIPTTFATANYFSVLKVQPQIGRFFSEEEDQIPESAESQGSVAVLSDALWTRQFGRDPGVLGRVIYVNRSACHVIGVAPRGFTGDVVGIATDVWVPLTPFSPRRYLEGRGGMFTRSLARLKPGVSLEQARAAMHPLYQQLLAAEWAQYPQWKPRNPRPIQEYPMHVRAAEAGLDSGVRSKFAKPLWIVMAIVAAVLLIACANVGNLLLARSTWRRREFGLRLALGCGRGRLMRQLLTESLMLAAMGAGLGLAISYWGSRSLSLMAGVREIDLGPDVTVLVLLAVVVMLTGIGFGSAPAWRAGRVDLAASLGDQARGSAGRHVRQRLSRTLVVTQVALSLALLIGAGLLIRSIYNLRHLDPGFRPEHVLIFDMAHNPRNREPVALARVAQQVHDRVRQIPSVRSASVSAILLFSGADQYGLCGSKSTRRVWRTWNWRDSTMCPPVIWKRLE